MICEDHKQERFILRNYFGEWKVESAPSSEVIPIVNTLKGGALDGVNVNDLADGTIVMVGGESAVVPVVEDFSINEDEDTTQENTQVNMEEYPEFDGIKWFTPQEFFCKCADQHCVGKGTVHMKHELLVVADRLRERYGKVTVTSGIRCPAHNSSPAVGGVTKSRHLDGKAMDFVVDGVGAGTTTNWAKCQPEIRYTYAITATATHMDVE